MLHLRRVVALYGHSLVLQGVSLEVEAEEVVALLGRNGAGKTTTLRTVMGLLRPRSGSILFEDRQLVGSPPHAIARLGISFVPDDRRIFPDLSVEENLELSRRAVGARPGPWDPGAVYELFPVLGEHRRRPGTQLSGGEQKMLALGRALVQNPRLLLLDEAAEGLAPLVVDRFVEAIGEIRETGITLLLADQNLRFARRVARRGYIIDKGAIQHQDRMDRIWADEELVSRYLAV